MRPHQQPLSKMIQKLQNSYFYILKPRQPSPRQRQQPQQTLKLRQKAQPKNMCPALYMLAGPVEPQQYHQTQTL
jgi:hypothetical protein